MASGLHNHLHARTALKPGGGSVLACPSTPTVDRCWTIDRSASDGLS